MTACSRCEDLTAKLAAVEKERDEALERLAEVRDVADAISEGALECEPDPLHLVAANLWSIITADPLLRAVLSAGTEGPRQTVPVEDVKSSARSLDYMCPNCVTPWKCNGPHLDGNSR